MRFAETSEEARGRIRQRYSRRIAIDYRSRNRQQWKGLRHARSDNAAFLTLWIFIATIPIESVVELPVLGSITRAVGAIALSAGFWAWHRRTVVNPFSRLQRILMLVILFSVMTVLWSDDWESSLSRAITYLQLALMALLIWRFAATSARLRMIMWAFLTGATVLAGTVAMNYMSGNSSIVAANYERYSSLEADPNDLALTLAIGLPIAFYLNVRSNRLYLSLASGCYVLIAIVGVLLSGSRGGLLSLGVSLCAAPLLLLRRGVSVHAVCAGLLVSAVAGGVLLWSVPTMERFNRLPEELATGTYAQRTEIWRASIDAFKEAPLTGTGIGNSPQAIARYYGEEKVAHNTYLSVLVEQGILGGILWTILAAWLVHNSIQLPSPERTFALVVLMVLGVGVASLSWEYRKPTWFVLSVVAVLRPPVQAGRGADVPRTLFGGSSV